MNERALFTRAHTRPGKSNGNLSRGCRKHELHNNSWIVLNTVQLMIHLECPVRCVFVCLVRAESLRQAVVHVGTRLCPAFGMKFVCECLRFTPPEIVRTCPFQNSIRNSARIVDNSSSESVRYFGGVLVDPTVDTPMCYSCTRLSPNLIRISTRVFLVARVSETDGGNSDASPLLAFCGKSFYCATRPVCNICSTTSFGVVLCDGTNHSVLFWSICIAPGLISRYG